MLNGIGLAFIALIASSIVTIASAVMKSDFPIHYASNDSIIVLATIIALNFATATFLLGSLLALEEKVSKKDVFEAPRREIKQNLYTMAGLLFLNIALVALISDNRPLNVFNTNIQLNYLLADFVIGILFYYIFLLLEIVTAAMGVRVPKS